MMNSTVDKMDSNNGILEYTLIEAEPIIGFNLWGERRICLPQLLRFVLPDFDINVIDRAVTDLQINCFQCDSEQMNLLHLNCIVPKEIVRCGLIRKSDAERLCKYLLQPNLNVDAKSSFVEFSNQTYIEVVHTCFGEQRGILFPLLYNSSDAKCIKCSTCDNFFKTFEFVGHTHKLDEVSNTFHWGFDSNNWRLLLQIYSDKLNINNLNKAKRNLDEVKTKFYDKELMKINKSCMNIVWRPSRKLRLYNPPRSTFLSTKPSHLRDGPVEYFKKNINRGLNSLNEDDINNSNYAPNVYLDTQDNAIDSELSIDDDDNEEYEDGDKSLKNSDDLAMNVALQIKNESITKDQISLGTISAFLNKKDMSLSAPSSSKIESGNVFLKSNFSPTIVAQAHTSIPSQFLMLEALWSQLFRDIIQLTQLVRFNSSDERSRLVGQLIRCQDLFRSQWTNLAEENQDLNEKLAQERKDRQGIEIIRDTMAISLKKLTIEKENLSELVRQLESRGEKLQSDDTRASTGSDVNQELSMETQKSSAIFKQYRSKFKRESRYENDVNESQLSDEEDDRTARKQIRLNISRVGNSQGVLSLADDSTILG